MSCIHSLFLCHGRISGKQQYVFSAVAFLLSGGHHIWSLWLNLFAFKYPFFPWESQCLPRVLIFPRPSWTVAPTASHSLADSGGQGNISAFSPKTWSLVISRQWRSPKYLRCSATKESYVFTGWKRRNNIGETREANLAVWVVGTAWGSSKGSMVVAGKNLMAKMCMRVCFRVMDQRNFWKPFTITPAVIAVKKYHA